MYIIAASQVQEHMRDNDSLVLPSEEDAQQQQAEEQVGLVVGRFDSSLAAWKFSNLLNLVLSSNEPDWARLSFCPTMPDA